jgi:hypothetical protein
MSGSRRCAIAPGLLTALFVVACAGTGAADHAPDSPESRLRARIADLRADVELLQVECAAARHNLMECLKTSGHLELGDRKMALSEIKNEIGQLKRMGQTLPFVDSNDVLEKMQHDAENGGNKEEKEETKLMADLVKGGAVGEKALDRMAEIEFQGRLERNRAESDRRKADFLKKIRSLHQKKLELAEAEAEYKSSR